nr:MAG TPA: PufQ cytochrome subunit [Caudoviricetes sp.]
MTHQYFYFSIIFLFCLLIFIFHCANMVLIRYGNH